MQKVCERSKVMTAEKVRTGLVWTGERGRGSAALQLGRVIVYMLLLPCIFVRRSIAARLRCLISTHMILVK